MRAARFHAANEPLRLEEVPDPVPGAGEAVVRVEACGICASDLHFILGEMPLPAPAPVTMGHEAAGVVEALGPGVEGWAPADRVALTAGKGCGACHACREGRWEDCEDPRVLGVHYDGAWAERVLVPAYSLTALPDAVPFEHGAIAADAIATVYSAIVDRAAVRPGDRVGLWGIGGLGTHAVQLARLAGAGFVAAVDPLPAARERALALGADVALDPSEDVPAAIRAAAGGRGLDAAFDLIGRAAVVKQALRSLARGGRAVVVGQSLEPIEAGPVVLYSFRALALIGNYGYRKRHLEAVLDLIATGRLDLSGSVSERLPLARVNEGV